MEEIKSCRQFMIYACDVWWKQKKNTAHVLSKAFNTEEIIDYLVWLSEILFMNIANLQYTLSSHTVEANAQATTDSLIYTQMLNHSPNCTVEESGVLPMKKVITQITYEGTSL